MKLTTRPKKWLSLQVAPVQETYKGEADESVCVFMVYLDPFFEAPSAEPCHLLAVAQETA